LTTPDHASQEEKLWAYRAMASCPAGAIRLRRPDPYVKEVVRSGFPIPVDEDALPGIYHLGYHSKQSLGTAPYLVVRPGKGNVMIDTPRFNGRLAAQVEALGGVRYNVITHEGSGPDHDLWKAYFPEMTRLVHRRDASRAMASVEALLNGKGPWAVDDDVKVLHLPGYTQGSLGVLYKPGPDAPGVLFSGRTLGWSPRLGRLDGVVQRGLGGSITKQAESIRALEGQDFQWIFPSEGMRFRFLNPDAKARGAILREAADAFEARAKQLPL
jgi:glyoxylase-like metal-dependent hydrolase (beta-lactamase superfamily II)